MGNLNLILKPQAGLTIVEIMIAITLGLMVVGAVTTLFLSSRSTLTDTEQVNALYDNARHGLTVMAEDLRLVDFWGATKAMEIVQDGALDGITSDCSGNAAGFDLANSLWAATATSASVAGCVTDAIVGSDALVVKHLSPDTTDAGDIASGTTYIMANPFKGVLFDGADSVPSTAAGGAVPDGEAREYRATFYYVGNSTANVPTLFRKRLVSGSWSGSEEVAAGVERLRFLFGVDSNGDGTAESWQPAASADWSNVVAVRVFLLGRSENRDPYYTDERTYQLGDVLVDPNPNDNYRRAVLDTTVNLRNRRMLITGDF